MSAITGGFSINVSGSPRRRAQRDTESYWRRLVLAGGTDINANDEIVYVQAFFSGLYNLLDPAPIAGIWTVRSGQQMGTGTKVLDLRGMLDGTLINGPTWGTDGLAFAASPSMNAMTVAKTVNGSAYTVFFVCKADATAGAFYQAWDGTGGGLNGPYTTGNNVNGGTTNALAYRGGADVAGSAVVLGVQNAWHSVMHAASLASTLFVAHNTGTGTGALTGAGNFVSASSLRLGSRNAGTSNSGNQIAFALVADADLRSVNTALRTLVRNTLCHGLL